MTTMSPSITGVAGAHQREQVLSERAQGACEAFLWGREATFRPAAGRGDKTLLTPLHKK